MIVQIESQQGVEQSSEIAAQDGVDAMMVGPVDLAVSSGIMDPGEKTVEEMTRQTLFAAATGQCQWRAVSVRCKISPEMARGRVQFLRVRF